MKAVVRTHPIVLKRSLNYEDFSGKTESNQSVVSCDDTIQYAVANNMIDYTSCPSIVSYMPAIGAMGLGEMRRESILITVRLCSI